jgi:hypothetical protein
VRRVPFLAVRAEHIPEGQVKEGEASQIGPQVRTERG